MKVLTSYINKISCICLFIGLAEQANAGFATGLQSAAPKPNILWITCEDMSAHLPMYGDSTVKTPNLSRLAKEGVKYTRMFSVAGVCAPSRSGIITGMFPASIGTQHMRIGANQKVQSVPAYEAVPPAYVKAFPEYLRAAGYYCTNNSKTDYQIGNPFTVWDESGKKAHWRKRPADKPFFAVFNINDTHESQIWENADQPLRVDPAKVPLPPYYPESPVIRKDIARYYDNIMRMDSIVGDILKQLDEDGLTENTIVFFFSDHGACLPWYKREMYDRGLHVPLIIRFPGKEKAGTSNNQLLSFLDLAPTVLSLTGASIPSHLQGNAFLGPQKSKEQRQYIFAGRDRIDERYDMVRAVRDSRFKYIRNYYPEKLNYMDLGYRKKMASMKEILRLKDEGKLNEVQQRWFSAKPKEELYDTESDPFELNNLADKPAYKPKLEEFRKVQDNWFKKTGDKGLLPEVEMANEMWPGGKQPETSKPDMAVVKKDGDGSLVKISAATEGASIGYRIGNDTSPWLLYTSPVRVKKGETLSAKAIRYGYKESPINSFTN